MIQKQLAPDVKTKYIKSQRTKRTVLLSTFIIWRSTWHSVAPCVGGVWCAKLRLNSLDDDIKDKSAQLKK